MSLVTLEKQPSPKKSQLRGIPSLNKMEQGIIRIVAQYTDGSPNEPKGILSKWRNDCCVLAREKGKIVWSYDDVSKDMQEILWGFIKEHYVFTSEQEKIGKNATLKTISNALQRFTHALNKYYVQQGMSPLNRFGYIMPNKWDTFAQQHTTLEVIALSNKMKELNAKNKFRHKLGPGGYKDEMPKWAKKEQELREAGIPDSLEGCMVCTRNWIRGRSHTDDSGRLITSSSEDWQIQVAGGERRVCIVVTHE
jgi:hypothetical protein